MPDTELSERAGHSFEKDGPPIVGIGASAGGLEALEQFLKNVPDNSGLAFVVVQHMDPTHRGMLPELLQRVTKMAVTQATRRIKVKPNCVYVIPPNKDLSVVRGVLQPLDPIAPRGLRLPILPFPRPMISRMDCPTPQRNWPWSARKRRCERCRKKCRPRKRS